MITRFPKSGCPADRTPTQDRADARGVGRGRPGQAWSCVQATQLLAGQVLTTRSAGTPQRAARSQPNRCQSSWPGACASVSMANRQPASSARRISRFGGSCRSGRELISTALPCSAQAAKTASASKSLSGRVRRPVPPVARTGHPGRADDTIRPVTVAEDVQVRVGDRGQHPPGHLRPLVLQAAVHRPDHHVQPGQQLVVLVERAVGEDVHLDAGEDPETLAAAPSLTCATWSSCSAQPVGGQPPGHRQPGRVVGQHQVLVAELDRGQRHLLDRRAAVGPVRVGVAVAAQRGAQRRGLGVQVAALGGHQPAQVDRLLAGQRLRHAAGRHVTDAGQLGERAVAGPVGQLVAGRPASAVAADRNARTR